MNSEYKDLQLLHFLLYQVHGIADLFTYERFAHLDKEQAWMMIQAAADWADKDLFPYFQEMDRHGISYENGEVVVHPQLKTIIQQAAEQGWIGASARFEHGGLQLPEMINNSAQHIFQAANNGVQGYIGLSAGAARLITNFGTKEQVDTFAAPIFEGRWQGTMALTEPQAGSSLTDITCKAIPQNDGTYKIQGQKIFISAGQHDACDNFVHLTLARIEGAPPGVKGISLFIIPKYRPEKETGLIDNDVFCAGEYQKMGQKTYATTHLVFGENDNCFGYLLGEANQGLPYMFQMMNEARIGVGQTAASVALAAYRASLKYAKERQQGRRPSEKDPMKDPIPIIRHADVQRMLLTQKVISEGALSLAMECNRLYDLTHVLEGEALEDAHLLLELLTPVVKTYSAEEGMRSTSLAVQVLGGYGYTEDFPLQQYYRDIKIMAIYEGTTGIQSMDLLGRKVSRNNGRAVQILVKEVSKAIGQARQKGILLKEAEQMELQMNQWLEVSQHLFSYAKKGQLERFLADANLYMEWTGLLIIGWQAIKMSLSAINAREEDAASLTQGFANSRIHATRFFFKYEMVRAAACQAILLDSEQLTLLEDDELF